MIERNFQLPVGAILSRDPDLVEFIEDYMKEKYGKGPHNINHEAKHTSHIFMKYFYSIRNFKCVGFIDRGGDSGIGRLFLTKEGVDTLMEVQSVQELRYRKGDVKKESSFSNEQLFAMQYALGQLKCLEENNLEFKIKIK